MIMNQTFPKNIRLNQSRIIREVFSDGVYKSLGVIGVKYKKTSVESSRFSISVRKNVGNAPCRNHIKRLLREAIRQKRSMLNSSYDFCFFVTSPPKNTLDYSYVLKHVKGLFNSLNKESCD
jgi:ribonuclease P protein component